ncbi:MAG: allophanate hydrolase [Phycisphaerae bacterium]
MPTPAAPPSRAFAAVRARRGPCPISVDLADELLAGIAAYADPATFIHVLPRERIVAQIESINARRAAGEALPLYGLSFAIKDNIDLAGAPTTAACPATAYVPERSAPAVERLMRAGAIAVGKANLDQFATGLVGVRSPYGTPRNPFDGAYVPGGSSSGSAVAVAAGLVSFALGTDTAGSGRVPAAFNNLVGLKATRGLIPTAGVVPACRSLDCVSVFALTCDDAAEVLAACAGPDDADPYARRGEGLGVGQLDPRSFKFGVPRDEQLEFFGDAEMAGLYARSIEALRAVGGEPVTFDLAPFLQAARLLYEGPWVTERYLACREVLENRPEAMMDVTRTIIGRGGGLSAADAFAGMYELRRLWAVTMKTWADADCLLLPTTGTIFTTAQVAAEPIALNSKLGYYTNFMNLLDLCGLALPAGFRASGLPGGVTLVAPAGLDGALLAIGRRFQETTGLPLGATGHPLPEAPRPAPAKVDEVLLAVVGAHLSGMPLNHQLTSRGARLVRACRTAKAYRLYVLPNTTPAKPGMVRGAAGGAAIEVEVWALSSAAFGAFVAEIPPGPLCIGTVELEDGQTVKGFLCEPHAVEGAGEITTLGGWRAYVGGVK